MDYQLRVLIVEDPVGVENALEHLLSSWASLNVLTCTTFLSACTFISADPRIDLLICGASLTGEMTGIDVAEIAVKTFPDISVIIIADDDQRDVPGMTSRYAFVRKPFDRRELVEHVLNAYMALKLRLRRAA